MNIRDFAPEYRWPVSPHTNFVDRVMKIWYADSITASHKVSVFTGRLTGQKSKIKAMGISMSQAQYAAIGGNCDACGQYACPLNLDHNHKTGCFRGYLCSSCNQALGAMTDSVSRLEGLLTYLNRAEGKL